MHWGARKLTNNTAELSAMRAACDEVVASVPKGQSATIASDSSVYVIGKILAGKRLATRRKTLRWSPGRGRPTARHAASSGTAA